MLVAILQQMLCRLRQNYEYNLDYYLTALDCHYFIVDVEIATCFAIKFVNVINVVRTKSWRMLHCLVITTQYKTKDYNVEKVRLTLQLYKLQKANKKQ